MANTSKRRPRTEIIIATAATIVSICAMITTVYQTYIIRQQQHAAVWPRLDLGHAYWVRSDTAFYNLYLRNDGVGPAIIHQVSMIYKGDSSFFSTAEISNSIASERNLPDTSTYYNYNDVIENMVIPQQEVRELLVLGQREYVVPWVEEMKGDNIQIIIQYRSLYGETWEIGYPNNIHRKID